jgi:DNA-binding LytR/AlgR family response regulator
MYKILIIEDEAPAARRLEKLILQLDSKISIVGILDSVEETLAWLRQEPNPDLIFSDIQLADGLSFQIFESFPILCPIIFATAYDEYAIKAFQHHSIDYLLKPIDPVHLQKAWNKYLALNQSNAPTNLTAMLEAINNKVDYKERFLIKQGDQFKYIKTTEVAYFFSSEGYSFLMDKKGKKFIVDDKLDQLESQLDPKQFYRINRKFIIDESAILKISSYFNSRLILKLNPDPKQEVIVSRERVQEFKRWLGS